MPKRRVTCKYREGNRRCGFLPKAGHEFCQPHLFALAEAARARRPAEVIADAFASFMQGKPINVDVTMGAFESLFSGFRPPEPGAEPSQPFWESFRRATTGQQQPPPRSPHPRAADDQRALLEARQVLGFTAAEVITVDAIKQRKRELNRRYHPDRAGPDKKKAEALTKKIARVNAAADLLLQSLQR